jgi:hypothetical protein
VSISVFVVWRGIYVDKKQGTGLFRGPGASKVLPSRGDAALENGHGRLSDEFGLELTRPNHVKLEKFALCLQMPFPRLDEPDQPAAAARVHVSIKISRHVAIPVSEFVFHPIIPPIRVRHLASDGGTLARDVVHYAVPLDFLVHRWLVPPDIEKIFAFRTQELRKRFSTRQDQRHRPRRRQFVRAPSLFASQPGLG